MSENFNKYTVFLEDSYDYTLQQIEELLRPEFKIATSDKKTIRLLFGTWTLDLEFNSQKSVQQKANNFASEYGIAALNACRKALDIYSNDKITSEEIPNFTYLLEFLKQKTGGLHIFDETEACFLWNECWMPEPGENYLDVNIDALQVVSGNRAVNSKVAQLQVNPNDAGLWNSLGIEYYNLKNYELALICFINTTILEDSYYWAHYNVGLCYGYLGKNAEAEEAYKKCLSIDPKYMNALTNLAKLYISQGQKELGISYFEQACEIDASDSGPYTNLGFNLLFYGELESAIIYIEKAIELGDHSYSNLNKGHYYLIKGEREKAIECYKASKNAYSSVEDFWAGYDSDYELMPQYNVSLEDYNALKTYIV